MNLLAWILFGLITGIIANMLDPHPERENIFTAMLLGVGGAVLGGVVANLALGISVVGFNLTSFLLAVIGSLIALTLSRSLRRA